MITVAPSILSGSHINLQKSFEEVRLSGARWIHLDIMDGHFVPNLTFGPETVRALAKYKGNLFFDVHLMLTHPAKFVEVFAAAGADLISFHVEAADNINATINQIHRLGKKVGLALNPETPIELVQLYLKRVDLIVIMGVNPGFGGQLLLPNCLEKIEKIRQINDAIAIEIDGGVTLENAKMCIEKGANILVTGSAFFKAKDKQQFIQEIENGKNDQ